MFTITRDTIGGAHETIVAMLVRDGEYVLTENGQETLELPEPLVVHVDHPMREPRTSARVMKTSPKVAMAFGPLALADYVRKVDGLTPKRADGQDASYTYGNRLRDHPWVAGLGLTGGMPHWVGDGDGKGIDQMPRLADMLAKAPSTRRAIAHTWVLERDIAHPEPPCIQTIQFLLRGGLNAVVYIRSNDMLSAWDQNAYALSEVLHRMALTLKVETGWLETISASAHLYYKRDAPELAAFRQALNI